MTAGSRRPNFDREHMLSRSRTPHVATFTARRHRLACGHEIVDLPIVTTPVGKADLYRCPEGCGLVRARA